MMAQGSSDKMLSNTERLQSGGLRYAVAYVRVSQEDETIENQINAIKEWANKNGFKVIATFKDKNVSGEFHQD